MNVFNAIARAVERSTANNLAEGCRWTRTCGVSKQRRIAQFPAATVAGWPGPVRDARGRHGPAKSGPIGGADRATCRAVAARATGTGVVISVFDSDVIQLRKPVCFVFLWGHDDYR